jgi:hypothetical protein
MKKIIYDSVRYDFVREIRGLYDVADLSEIHNQWSESKLYDILDHPLEDQKTVYHEKFYHEVKEKTNFYSIYHSFVDDVIKPLFDDEILYQKIPTFRVHQPGNLAVAAYHRDKEYGHSEHEINFYLPLTRAWGTNTIWVESEYDKKDFQPMVVDVGEVVMWAGVNLLHGNKLNDTGKSRVSVDFRILPLSLYDKETNNVSSSNKTLMTIGGYWEKLEKIHAK